MTPKRPVNQSTASRSFWELLGIIWELLGVIWELLGVIWELLRVIWELLGVKSMKTTENGAQMTDSNSEPGATWQRLAVVKVG